MIQVENLVKTFRVHKKEPGLVGSLRSLFNHKWVEKTALRGVSLEIHAGEIVGLVGPNGAGKTTLIKALAGIIHPSSGEARVLGFTPWERKNDFRRQIALIMGQKAQLWWDLPAADCFLLLREIYQIPVKQYAETLDFLTDTLHVREQMKIQIRRLSLGERMKMELIAALLHQPKVVFLDEPTIGLDFTAQRAIRDFILHYRKLHQPAMILTSHYMEDIKRLCERIIIIREGEFVYDGSMKKIINDYALHKIITVQLPIDQKNGSSKEWLEKLGEILTHTPELIRLKVKRERVSEAAAAILQNYTVNDLNIDEEEIGSIIENLMHNTKSQRARA